MADIPIHTVNLLIGYSSNMVVCPLTDSSDQLLAEAVTDLSINLIINNGDDIDLLSGETPATLNYSESAGGHKLVIPSGFITGYGYYSCIIKGSNIQTYYLSGTIAGDPGSLDTINNNITNIPSSVWQYNYKSLTDGFNFSRDILTGSDATFVLNLFDSNGYPLFEFEVPPTIILVNNDTTFVILTTDNYSLSLNTDYNKWVLTVGNAVLGQTGRYMIIIRGSTVAEVILSGNIINPSSGSGITPQDISNIPELVWEYPGDRLLSITPATQADIIGLNNLSASDIGTALETYDALKKTDFDTAIEIVNTNIGNVTVDTSGLATAENLETANTNIGLIKATTDDLTLANIRTQVDNGLTAFAGPTKAELEAAFTEIKGAGWTNETLETIKAALITAANVWGYTTRELTSSSSGGATAQEVWEYTARTLTEVPSGVALATDLETANGKLDAIKLKTDNIPASAIPSKAEFDSAVGTINTNIGNVTIDTSDLATAENLELANGKLDAIKLRTDTIAWTQIKEQLIMAIGNYQVPVGGIGIYTASISGVGTAIFSVDADGNRTLNSITLE